MGEETTIRAGVMVYTIKSKRLYSNSLPEEGAEIVRIVSQEAGKQFEVIVKIHGHLWHLWSGKPIDEIRESVDEDVNLREALTKYELAEFRAQRAAAHVHLGPFGPWAWG